MENSAEVPEGRGGSRILAMLVTRHTSRGCSSTVEPQISNLMMGFRLPPPAPSLVVGLRPIFDDSGCRACSPSGGAFRRHAGWAPEAPFVLWAARAFKRHGEPFGFGPGRRRRCLFCGQRGRSSATANPLGSGLGAGGGVEWGVDGECRRVIAWAGVGFVG